MRRVCTLKKSAFSVKSRRAASSCGVPNAIVGIRLSPASAYDSLRRLTKSTSTPQIRIVAVSRCLDCSGFAAMSPTVDDAASAAPRPSPPSRPLASASTTRSAKVAPLQLSSATSTSLVTRPSALSRTQPPQMRTVVCCAAAAATSTWTRSCSSDVSSTSAAARSAAVTVAVMSLVLRAPSKAVLVSAWTASGRLSTVDRPLHARRRMVKRSRDFVVPARGRRAWRADAFLR
mmetsp:Transcript_14223/g.40689  ORF Transcript_14223/g.40689 Transcript_14223/m.40689 type:complete len:232 (+) Transcript_14223:1221-1916(+)